jgi:hypothetical protein
MREEITVLRLTIVWELLIRHILVGHLFHITQPDVRLTTTSHFGMHNNSYLTVCLVSQHKTMSVFILTSVILLTAPLNYSH